MFQIPFHAPDLMVASMFVQQRDNGLNVILLDDIQHLWTLNQNTVQHLQDSCRDNTNIRVTKLIPIYNNTVFLLYLVLSSFSQSGQ